MSRRMTVVFDDEELYTALKVEAARVHRPAKDLVAEALRMLFEATRGERDAILVRAGMKGHEEGLRAPVEEMLKELGLSRENAPLRR